MRRSVRLFSNSPCKPVLHLAGEADHRGKAALHVLVGRAPGGDADTHGGLALPDGRAAPAGSIVLNGSDHGAGALWLAKGDEDLIERDLVKDQVASVAQTLRRPCAKRVA
jgi:hypothetical protein